MVCSRCHQEKATAVERVNPYDEDVNGIVVLEILCDGCADAIADDI